ncbi:cobyric acid synthase CobQ, partial [Vibrio splendidus]
ICGGYQMLGNIIHDPDGVEGEPGSSEGLGYLDTETTLTQQKTLTNVRGTMTLDGKTAEVKGYEIHVGRTDVKETVLPVQLESGSLDGAVNQDNSIFGTYLHGVFDNSDALSLICEWAGANDVTAIDHEQLKELGINRIADAIEEHLNLDLLWPELTI